MKKKLIVTGYAHPLDEVILTPEGFKQIKDIQIGDYVFSEKGSPIKVINTIYSINLRMYNITFNDDTSVRCCEDHLWKVQTPKLRVKNKFVVLP